jgi:hypothetical protein
MPSCRKVHSPAARLPVRWGSCRTPSLTCGRSRDGEKDTKKVKQIIDFLCADSGSHDYTMNRREAAELGLCISGLR